jgi:hypothetical protein
MSGTIQLFLDKPAYLSGDIVSGRADLSVTSNVVAQSLMIKWKGFERTKMSKLETYVENEQTHVRTVWVTENRDFFKQAIPLCNFGSQVVVPGTYSYNFKFQLPHNLPGVFSSRTHNCLAAIIYKVKVFVDMQGKDIKNKSYITINENLHRAPQAIHVQNEKSFLFGGSKKLKLFVTIPKDVFAPGERVPLRIKVENETKKDVGNLKAKLMQDLHIKCKEGLEERSSREIHRATFEGVKSKSSLEKDFIFELPRNVYPSTNAHLISNQYHLDVECDVAMAIDLEVHPKISIAMPNGSSGFNIYSDFQKGCWK